MNLGEIEVNPDVCNGPPVVRGTRIAVESILGMLAAGDSVEEVLRAQAARLMHNQYSLDPVS